jgi:hypothetical protein
VVHLILDEHIGVAGLPADLPGLGTMKSRLESFYTSRGFDLWTHAYSHYASSQDAIPSILNGRLVEQAGGFFEGMKTRDLRENRLFDIYQGRGLALSVYQSRYINYCAHPSTGGCFQYNDNAIGSLEGAPLDDWEKAWVIGSHYLGTNAMWRTWGRRAPGRDRLRMKVGPLSTFPSTLERLERDILAARESTAFFAHLHMPHSPYVYDASCRVRPVSEWLQHNSGSYTDRYQRYGDQVECLLSRMDDLLDSLKAAGLLERTTIVLHGDHGSRITRRKPHEQDPVDLLSLHSTLVAIRSPGAAQGRRIDDVRSVTEILWKEVARQEPALQAGAAPAIYRRRAPHERELISMPLPPIW